MIKRLLFILLFLFVVASCKSTHDAFLEDYPQLEDKGHLYEVVNADFVVSLLTNPSDSNYKEQTILILGFKVCPWCQAVVPFVNEVAKEKGYRKVYYVDIYDMRNNDSSPEHPKYLQIKEKLAVAVDATKDRINAPTVVVLKEGRILSYHLDTVESHVYNEKKILPPMTSQQKEELRDIFRTMFKKD